MDYGLMRRHIDAAIAFRTGQAEHVIILVDRSADSAQRIMAVCQNIRDREFFQSGCTCCLNDSDEGDIMGDHLVKSDLQILHVTGSIMCSQDTICHRSLTQFCLQLLFFFQCTPVSGICRKHRVLRFQLHSRIRPCRDNGLVVNQIYALFRQFHVLLL